VLARVVTPALPGVEPGGGILVGNAELTGSEAVATGR
jgi:hypothetical protein